MWSFPPGDRPPEDARVQRIDSPRAIRVPIAAAVAGTLAGSALLAGGVFLAWLAFATPIIGALTPAALRPTLPQMALGGVVWAVALTAPPLFAIVGAWRISRTLRALVVRPARPMLAHASEQLDDDHFAASDVRLPDGRTVGNIVVGPFGLAVINEMPRTRPVRTTGTSWEIRGPRGRWIPIENPMERTARDGERIKRWFGSAERDYVLKVYAALVSTDPTLPRTPGCAVVTPEQLPGWLAALPPARSITAERRAEIVEQVSTLL
jgi:membrane protein implicated in regulation of membrane protease activity